MTRIRTRIILCCLFLSFFLSVLTSSFCIFLSSVLSFSLSLVQSLLKPFRLICTRLAVFHGLCHCCPSHWFNCVDNYQFLFSYRRRVCLLNRIKYWVNLWLDSSSIIFNSIFIYWQKTGICCPKTLFRWPFLVHFPY